MQIKFLSSKNTSIIDQKIWELYMMIVNVLFFMNGLSFYALVKSVGMER